MAITYTSAVNGSTFNTFSPITTGTLTLVANSIVVVCAVLTDANPAGTLSVTNSGTAMTWTQIDDTASTGCRVAAWWAKSDGAENRTVSVAWSSGSALQHVLYAIVLNGAHTTNPVPSGKVFKGLAASSVTQTITPTAAGSALWMVCGDQNGIGTPTMTAGTNCTLDQSLDVDQFSSILLRPTTQPRTDAAAFTLSETHTGSGVNWIAFEVQAAASGPAMAVLMHHRKQMGIC